MRWKRNHSDPPPLVYEVSVTQEPDGSASFEPRLVQDDERVAWLTAADTRELSIWKDIDVLLKKHEPSTPLRVALVRKSLKWLREEAAKEGMFWGVNHAARHR